MSYLPGKRYQLIIELSDEGDWYEQYGLSAISCQAEDSLEKTFYGVEVINIKQIESKSFET